MTNAISIEGLRGIRHGTLEGLTPLTILTGVNGSGKSTVLDALLIAESSKPEEAIAHTVGRRRATLFGVRWLVNARERHARIASTSGPGKSSCTLKLRDSPPPLPEGNPQRVELQRRYRHHIEIDFEEKLLASKNLIPDTRGWGWVAFDGDNEFITSGRLDFDDVPDVHIIDPGIPTPLDRAYSEATRLGHRDELVATLQALVPGLTGVEILSEDDGRPALYVVRGKDGAVPVGVAGDGVQALIQLAVEFAARPGGLVLVEEPEVYQHPAALRLTARVIVATVRRGVQVVLTTHSLELIDMLVAESSDDDLVRTSLFTLSLPEGELRYGRLSGEQIAGARGDIAEDLR